MTARTEGDGGQRKEDSALTSGGGWWFYHVFVSGVSPEASSLGPAQLPSEVPGPTNSPHFKGLPPGWPPQPHPRLMGATFGKKP